MGKAIPTKLSERVAYSPDRSALQAQQSTVGVAHGVNQLAFASGNLLDRDQDATGRPTGNHTGIPFAAGQVRILSHGLRRVPQGFIISDSLGYAVLSASPGRDAVAIALQSQSACTVKIWVW